MTCNSALNRRSFLARSAALAAAPAAVTLARGPVAEAASADALPDYAPIPPSALGPPVNAQGYFVGRVKKNLYWVTDGTYQAAFLTTRKGVVLFDAPPTIGRNLQRAIDEIASATRVSNKVTHLVYSHHHADHVGASSLFDRDVVRVGHVDAKRLLARDNAPARRVPVPLPDVTFETRRTLHVGGERIDLAWHGSNHSPDNIYIHLPDHDTLMLVDINLPGWAPFDSFGINENVQGSIAAADRAMAYPWKHYIGGHMGRLGNRGDMVDLPAVRDRPDRQHQEGHGGGRPDPVLRQVREQQLGRGQGVPGRADRVRLRAGHQEVHRRPRRRRRLHGQHHVPPARVDPPRPRVRHADPPVTGAGAGPGPLAAAPVPQTAAALFRIGASAALQAITWSSSVPSASTL